MKLDLPTQVTTNRLVLRRLTILDAGEIYSTYASRADATRYMSWPTHRSIEDTHAFLEYANKAWEEGSDYTWTIRRSGDELLLGSIGVVNMDGKVQFGYILGPEHWGKGYATEAVTAIIDLLRRQDGIYRIATYVDAENRASCRVLEKSGLVMEARLSRWERFINQGNEPRDCVVYRVP